MNTTTTTRYEINGQPIAGWDHHGDTIDLDAAAANLTDHDTGDTLTAIVEDLDDRGSLVEVTRAERTL